MPNVAKFTDKAARRILCHSSRSHVHPSNTEIDRERTKLNYNLAPDRGMSAIKYYEKRLGELYVYGRSDVKTMCGWIVTLPKELKDPTEQRAFFENVYAFLIQKYGEENCVSADVHYDEGFVEKVVDKWGNYLTDENGKTITKIVGQPHLHFNWIPATKNTNKNHAQAEKCCAKEVINRRALITFHDELDAYLKKNNVKGEVKTGITKRNGRNYTVGEIKAEYMSAEIERLRKIEEKYIHEHKLAYNKGGIRHV